MINPQNLNSYAYGANSPVIFVDPDGNFSIRFDQLPVFKHYARWVNNNAAESSNLSVSMTPIVGDVQDAYEAISGNETFTGEQLSGGERALSGVAAVVPFIGGAIIREGAQQIAKHTDKIKTLYHGSVDNFGDIMKDGFSSSKDLFVTDNILDAVKYSQKRVNAIDPGVVRLDVPKSFFDKFVKSLQDFRYTNNDFKMPEGSKIIDKLNSYINKSK